MDSKTAKFTIKDYGKQPTFTSFLPGISGLYGVPIWCFYVNRGQCISSFGLQDKDHAIMEFYPAHQAYQNVKRTGFRTFLKRNGKYFEPFKDESKKHLMNIFMNNLEIEETDEENKILTRVSYFNLPGEKIGALVRKLTIKNLSADTIKLEILDGMPSLIPYGVDMMSIKAMGQTIKAWMQVEDVDKNLPYFKVRVSTKDSASVSEIAGGNFSFACLSDGTRLRPIVDPDIVFTYDTSLYDAVGFIENDLESLINIKQVTDNQLPCNFYGTACELKGEEKISIYQLIGQVESKELLEEFMAVSKDYKYFEKKREEAEEIAENLCSGIETKTASYEFDAYCKYTYLDNVLRGGYPIKLGKDKVFYVYSRKHGDPERDYNYFSVLPEFYSQGNGNFRDINQNRRCDVFFAPFIGTENLKLFYSLIQLDGYNPLVIEKVTYAVEKKDAEKLLLDISKDKLDGLLDFIEKPFTPGSLFKKLDSLKIFDEKKVYETFIKVMDAAHKQVNSDFGEGYWSDHWAYNLDLVENYLDVFPEKEKEILYEEAYTYFRSQINVNPRFKRYAKTVKGIRQYYALNKDSKNDTNEKLVRCNYGKGEILLSTLMEKLLLLCATKFSTLDAYGMGVEMEGGKPGWYDALNGLPGIFGSSMAETYELKRHLKFTIDMLNKYPAKVKVIKELADFIDNISVIVKEEMPALMSDMEVISFWNKVNDAKEAYRGKVYCGISGEKTALDSLQLAETLSEWYKVVEKGINKACSLEEGICPTYFAYEVTEYEKNENGIMPKHFKVVKIPLFLEGPVRYMKMDESREDKLMLYNNIKNSDLYDKKLSMYKVNASLKDASYEIGRAKAFTPGWLENESVWLHMEYKYLLELLKSGLYKEFFEDLHKAAIPFLDPKVYGRSIFENSSFIASSKNSNEKYHGKGFVARLSGSTIEFINMWKIMMFGRKPFYVDNGELTLSFRPAVPKYLIGNKDTISAKFLSTTTVIYVLGKHRELIPGEYSVKGMECMDITGSLYTVNGPVIQGNLAKSVREGRMKEIKVYLN